MIYYTKRFDFFDPQINSHWLLFLAHAYWLYLSFCLTVLPSIYCIVRIRRRREYCPSLATNMYTVGNTCYATVNVVEKLGIDSPSNENCLIMNYNYYDYCHSPYGYAT